MTNIEQWTLQNDRFLASRLADLRARLDSFISARSEDNDRAEHVNRDEAHDHERSQRPALHILGDRLGLSAFEQDILFLCAAMELDPQIPRLCALAQSDASRAYPTFALAMSLFDAPAWDVMSPERPLRRLRLVEINQPGSTPLTAASLRADERVVNYIKGLNYLDDRLTPLLVPMEVDADLTLPASQQQVVDSIVHQLTQASSENRPLLPLVQIVGSDAASKQAVASGVAARFGLELLRLPADLVPTDFHELETLIRLWDREHRLLPLALYIDASEFNSAELERPSSPQSRLLARAGGLLFVDTVDTYHLTGRIVITVEVSKPTPVEQRQAWRDCLDDDDAADAIASELAGQFSLNVTSIERIARLTTTSGDLEGQSLRDRFWNGCRKGTRPRLDVLAQRIDAKATWNDLVLPADEALQLREIADQIHHRGRVYDDWGFRAKHNRGLGVSVLFAGESGTGKTMAAEVIANALQLDLYRIDLSAVVNKYIGETEKNLRKLFDAADDSGAILFFDEADSLFGKRTEVKDSHDRYANLEVNYLLQRMEAYRGLAILATNLRSSVDAAFLRRLRFLVNFPVPDVAQRREMWRKAFPAETPVAPLDLDRLARLNITGGSIHSIALNAAFAGARDGELELPHILKAARTEFKKLQKPINVADFKGLELEGSAR